MADWDADDFEPEVSGAAVPQVSDKWDGEDEDDDVKVRTMGEGDSFEMWTNFRMLGMQNLMRIRETTVWKRLLR